MLNFAISPPAIVVVVDVDVAVASVCRCHCGTTMGYLIICWPVMVWYMYIWATVQHSTGIDTPGHQRLFIDMFVLDLYESYIIKDLYNCIGYFKK